jgi:hypothetical protein
LLFQLFQNQNSAGPHGGWLCRHFTAAMCTRFLQFFQQRRFSLFSARQKAASRG